MTRHKTTTLKVSLADVETILWALYCLDKDSLDEVQRDNIKRLEDRLTRAEERVLPIIF